MTDTLSAEIWLAPEVLGFTHSDRRDSLTARTDRPAVKRMRAARVRCLLPRR